MGSSSSSSSSSSTAMSLLALFLLLALQLSSPPPPSLALIVRTSGLLPCSRKCESKFCAFPPLLRYGKYCGIGYTGCVDEEPCDGIDACCRTHDSCIGDNLSNYLNKTCNENLLQCVARIRNSAKPHQFQGATCGAKEVTTTIELVMDVATRLNQEQQAQQSHEADQVADQSP